ncbi:MAG: hypothetical protein ABI914_06015, partial [Acidobacteriota bacterium]
YGSRIERLLLPFGQETPLDASLATIATEAQLCSLSPRAGERGGVRGRRFEPDTVRNATEIPRASLAIQAGRSQVQSRAA